MHLTNKFIFTFLSENRKRSLILSDVVAEITELWEAELLDILILTNVVPQISVVVRSVTHFYVSSVWTCLFVRLIFLTNFFIAFWDNFTGKIACIQVSYSERQKQNKRIARKKEKENVSNKLQTKLAYLDALKILTGKKHRQIKLQRMQNVQIWTFGLLVQQINSL